MIPSIPKVPNMPPRTIGENLVCGKQAYTRSQDTNFWKFADASNPSEAAEFINKACSTEALRFIDDNSDAVAKWQDLDNQFRQANGSNT